MRKLLGQVDPVDVLAIASVAVVAVGAAMVFVPAAFLIVGALGLVYAVALSRGEER